MRRKSYIVTLRKGRRTKKVRVNPISGEWWIIDGSAHFADGDIGDMNHEAYVRQHLAGIFLDAMDIGYEEQPSIEGEEHQIIEWLVNEKDVDRDAAENDPAKEAYKVLIKKMVPKQFKNEEQFEQAFFIAWGSGGRNRAVDYSIKYDGWKRVAGNWIETYTLTKEDLRDISRGLEDIVPDEDSEELFNIEVRANNKNYVDIPISVIDAGNVAQLQQYKSL